MATDVRATKATPQARCDAVVETHLAKARSRLRLLDVSTALLGFAAASLAYGLLMAVADRWLELSDLSRQLALAAYVLGAGVYLYALLVRPALRSLNPYYLARQMERTVPTAKNSIVNWLDLRGQPLPPSILASLGQRAAKDLQQTDLEQAISGRRALALGGVTAAMTAAALAALLYFGPPQFLSLLGRTFLPFGSGAIATRTQLTLLQPANGDATVPVGQSVRFTVQVDGYVPSPDQPDALRLHFRYQQSDPYETQLLDRDVDREWSTMLAANQVQNGFWYKVSGGDTQTPEYYVTVRSSPLVTGLDVRYHYRPYLHWRDERSRDGNLKALRGTEVELTARTNRNVKAGRLELDLGGERKTLAAQLVADEPQALRFKLTLEKDGKYRLWFTSAEGEGNVEPLPYTITVLTDQAPKVELSKPGEDTTLAANALLELEGAASDDIGVKRLTLQMKVVDGPALAPKPYRGDKSFRLAVGGYPRMLDYRDAVDLGKVRDAEDRPLALKSGMVLEYWLEAADSCDFPGPNVGSSKHYRVTIQEQGGDPQQQAQQRQQAGKKQREHEKKQDQKLEQENQERQQEQQEQEAAAERQQNENQPGQGEKKPGEGAKPEGDQGEKQPNEANKENDGAEQPKKPGADQQDNDLKKTADKLADALKKQEQKPSKGEAKDDPKQKKDQQQEPGQPKDAGAEKPQDAGQEKGDNGGGQKQEKAGNKDGGAGPDMPQPGEAKDKPDGDGQEQPGAGKDKGKPQDQLGKKPQDQGNAGQEPKPGDQGEPMGPADQQPGPKGEAKDAGQPKGTESTPQAGAKDEGNKGGGPKPDRAETKPEGQPQPTQGEQVAKGEKKEDQPAGEPNNTDAARNDPEKGEQSPEVKKLTRQMQNGDEQQKEQAKEQLEDLAKNAPTPEQRQEAKEALEREEQREASKPATAKKPPSEPKASDPKVPPCECKGSKSGQGKGAGKGQGGGNTEASTAQGQGPKGENKPSQAQAAANGQDDKGGKPGQSKPTPSFAKGGDAANRDGQTVQAGRPGMGDRRGEGGADQPSDIEIQGGGAADARHGRRAGNLQVDDFSKVNRKVLDDAKISDEEWAAFRKAYPELLKRMEQEQAAADKLRGPQRGGSLSNMGAREVRTTEPGKAGDVKYRAGPQAPSDLRKGYKEFSRSLSELERAADKK